MKLILIVLIALFLVVVPTKALAHTGTSQPFLILNGKYATSNEIRGSIIKEMDMPGDVVAEPFLIGEKIVFEIDTKKTLIPAEVLKKAKFYWDFGDGQTSEGIKSLHSYKKMGSYILSLSAGYLNNKPTVLDTVLLHVVPSGWHRVPVAIISVQGKKILDPNSDLAYVKPGQAITLEAISDLAKPALKYLWDLGDGTSSLDKEIVRKYPKNYSFVSPIVRIEDKDGFISYAYANIEFSENAATTNSSNNRSRFMIPIGVTVLILLAIFIFHRKLKLRSN